MANLNEGGYEKLLMLKLIKSLTLFSALFLSVSFPALAQNEAAASAFIQSPIADSRISKLKKFLNFYHSPLSRYAENFVETADEYQLDWKLIPAISGVESTFGKAIPIGSYNAYGWANGEYYFQSWEEGIGIVAKTLRENYYDRGADTVEKIAPIYAPPSQTWAWKVKYLMEKLENFAPASPLALELSL